MKIQTLPAIIVISMFLVLTGCDSTEPAVNDTSAVESTNTSTTPSNTNDTEASETENKYEDGEYSATGHYTSPAGEEEVELTVTLENGVIVDSTFAADSAHPTSNKMQNRFEEGYAVEVNGMNIDEVSLDVVNGSSLTPKGFADALDQIKQQAAA